MLAFTEMTGMKIKTDTDYNTAFSDSSLLLFLLLLLLLLLLLFLIIIFTFVEISEYVRESEGSLSLNKCVDLINLTELSSIVQG